MDTNTVQYAMKKIDVLWFENIEFAKVVLDWDDFFAGFTPAERKIYNYFA